MKQIFKNKKIVLKKTKMQLFVIKHIYKLYFTINDFLIQKNEIKKTLRKLNVNSPI